MMVFFSQVWHCASDVSSSHKRSQIKLLAELEHDAGVRILSVWNKQPGFTCFDSYREMCSSYTFLSKNLKCVYSLTFQVNTIGLNPAGSLLVSGCKDGTVTIWDTSSYEALQQVPCHTGTIHHTAFSPGGWGQNVLTLHPRNEHCQSSLNCTVLCHLDYLLWQQVSLCLSLQKPYLNIYSTAAHSSIPARKRNSNVLYAKALLYSGCTG